MFLIVAALLSAGPQPLDQNPQALVGDTHFVVSRVDQQWLYENVPLPPRGSPPVPVEQDKLHFVFIRENGSTTLTVTNGFKTGYRYKAYIPSKDNFDPTSTCTVGSGMTSIEHWPAEIEAIILDDFVPSTEMICRD